MSIFNNISFMNEGEQAEEYLKKKQKEIHADKKSDPKYSVNRIDSNRLEAGKRTELLVDKRYAADNNPRFGDYKKSKSVHDKYKKLYPDATPGFRHKDKAAYDKAIEKEMDERRYASRMLDNDREHDFINKYDEDYNKAYDAARKHYRRTHKNECGLFESVEFINE